MKLTLANTKQQVKHLLNNQTKKNHGGRGFLVLLLPGELRIYSAAASLPAGNSARAMVPGGPLAPVAPDRLALG